jgi:hypothetical protein
MDIPEAKVRRVFKIMQVRPWSLTQEFFLPAFMGENSFPNKLVALFRHPSGP